MRCWWHKWSKWSEPKTLYDLVTMQPSSMQVQWRTCAKCGRLGKRYIY